MKLLGWMHSKFKQSNNEIPKNLSIGFTGQPSIDDEHCYPRGSYGSKFPGKAQRRDNYFRKSFTSLDAARAEEDDSEEERAVALTELFHEFLAIGTLGTELITSDPATPEFSISVDHIAEKVTQVTEDELKLINDELEKVLGAEGKDENFNISSGRNSHVSAGRMSHCSVITLGGKPIESAEVEGNAEICLLQSYLFGSAIAKSETASPVKRDQRTCLGELFQKTKHTEEKFGNKSDTGEKRNGKEADKPALHLIKKLLKRRIIHSSAKSCIPTSGGTSDSTAAERKLHKRMQILHIFNRKVHPEILSSDHHSNKPAEKQISNKTTNDAVPSNVGLHPSAEDIIIYPQEASKDHYHMPQIARASSNTSGKEFWVNTDADYLVLELESMEETSGMTSTSSH